MAYKSLIVTISDDLTGALRTVLAELLNVCVWSGVWGVDGGWMPLPPRPQRYCDPASLVSLLYYMSFMVIFSHFKSFSSHSKSF